MSVRAESALTDIKALSTLSMDMLTGAMFLGKYAGRFEQLVNNNKTTKL